ncbi:TPA: antA/AntB antirepressor family protein, partial [Escherichia coli]
MKQEVMIQIFESDFNNDGLVQTVNARDLHEALEIGWDFSTWIERQLGDFKENQDFIIFHKKVEKSKGRPMKDYALTLDTAKHICMMSRCEKGKQLRQYFIEVEKQYRLGYTAPAPQTANTEQQQIINAAIAAINNIAQVAIQAMQSVQVTALPAQQQHTEPVQALPPTVGVHNPCPANKISLNKMKNYVSNETLLKELINGFGLVGELFDPGCVEGTTKAARPYMVYNKNQVAAMLKAAQVLADKVEGGKRRLLGRT